MLIDNNMKINKNKKMGEKYFELIRKKTLWEEYSFDAESKASEVSIRLKMKALHTPIKVQIPLKANIRYTHIQNLKDHNLSNNLVLDMIIRNEEFQNYMYHIAIFHEEHSEESQEEQKNHYRKLQSEMIKEFGFDIKDDLTLIAHHPYINEQITEYVENVANENLILNPPFISDIKNGMQRVIDFYFEKKELYILIPSSYEKIDDQNLDCIDDKSKLYIKIFNSTYCRDDYILFSVYEENKENFNRVNNDIYKLPPAELKKVNEISNDFIIKNFLFLGIPVTTFGKEKIVSLAEKNFPIELLDSDFKASLTENDMVELSIRDTEYKSILPDIKLSNSKSVNININPNLSYEEFQAKIANIQANITKIKSFTDIFNSEIDAIEKIKNLSNIAKTKEKRNRDYANAFYIYDLYKIIGAEFEKKIFELQHEAEVAIKKIENNVQFESKEIKQHEYDKINTRLENHKSVFSKACLDAEIQKITQLEISKQRGLHALMKEYIDNKKFKNVILGQ